MRDVHRHLREPSAARAGLICDVAPPHLRTISQTGPFLRFSQTPSIAPRPSPALGEHGAAVLAEAGFAAGEIAALV
jgi:crotonobetainyl-CoA:carnitine CoA-transferase CaiB-like acyl-CoA transferase